MGTGELPGLRRCRRSGGAKRRRSSAFEGAAWGTACPCSCPGSSRDRGTVAAAGVQRLPEPQPRSPEPPLCLGWTGPRRRRGGLTRFLGVQPVPVLTLVRRAEGLLAGAGPVRAAVPACFHRRVGASPVGGWVGDRTFGLPSLPRGVLRACGVAGPRLPPLCLCAAGSPVTTLPEPPTAAGGRSVRGQQVGVVT